MNFDDHDWELDEPGPARALDRSDLLKVAIGITIGMVLGGALVYGLGRIAAPSAPAGALHAAEQALRSADPTRAGPVPAPPAAPVASAPAPAIMPPAAALPASPPRTGAVPVTPMPASASRRAAERKEQAWAAQYAKPAACDDNPPADLMIECANHYIRARRAFEAAYGAEKP